MALQRGQANAVLLPERTIRQACTGVWGIRSTHADQHGLVVDGGRGRIWRLPVLVAPQARPVLRREAVDALQLFLRDQARYAACMDRSDLNGIVLLRLARPANDG